jgi:hypothetical protein
MPIDIGDTPTGTPPTTGEKLQIRTAIGLGQTDAPTFAGTSIQSQTDGAHTFRVRNIAGADLITINTSTRNVTLAGEAFNCSTSTGNFSSYNAGAIAWSDAAAATIGTLDLFIRRDAAGILAQRNGTAAQAFRVYNTFPGTTANEWFEIDWKTTANTVRIGTNQAGTGGTRQMILTGGGGSTPGFQFNVGAAATWIIDAAGAFKAGFDNTFDIGASGANRPRDIYAAGTINSGSNVNGSGIINALGLTFQGRGSLSSQGNGILKMSDNTTSDFSRLQLGSTTDASPAIARDGAGIKFTGAAAGSTSWIKVPAVAVSALPSAATAGAGARAFVNDALAPVFGSAVASGGTVNVPVYSNGTNWFVG